MLRMDPTEQSWSQRFLVILVDPVCSDAVVGELLAESSMPVDQLRVVDNQHTGDRQMDVCAVCREFYVEPRSFFVPESLGSRLSIVPVRKQQGQDAKRLHPNEHALTRQSLAILCIANGLF